MKVTTPTGREMNLRDVAIKTDNPRLCLLPLRYFGKCYQCPYYVSKVGKPCDSRIINPEGEAILKRILHIKEEIKRLKEEEKRLWYNTN